MAPARPRFASNRWSGIGIEYAMVDTREPDQHVRQHYINVGTTYWIEDSQMMTTGSRSLFVTARRSSGEAS